MTALSRGVTVALLLALGMAVATPASAGPPSDALRGYVDRLFVVLDDTGLKGPARAAERQRTVRALAEEALDLNESSRRALGAHWDARTAAERARFVRLFTDLIDQAYISRISLDGESIALDGETVTGPEAVVKGRALSKSGGATPVQFFLVQGAEGRWRVYDVSFEGMSLVGSYRAQFNKIIRASSFDELVNRLEGKTRGDAQTSGEAAPKTSP
jgi:phospholipid transport system substrate-binding protein